jgi:endonuclease/exonuclease/phosphatase family metal-dependent hydrolase
MVLLCVTTASWSAQVRVATYNIKFLSTEVVNQGDHLSKLREVMDALDAHIIGIQEIAARAAEAPAVALGAGGTPASGSCGGML